MTSFVPGTKLVIYDKSGAWHKTLHFLICQKKGIYYIIKKTKNIKKMDRYKANNKHER